MESSTTSSGCNAVGAATMAEAFRLTADQFPDRVAVRTKEDEVSLTWGDVRDRVDALAGGLAKLGVGRGDTVALMFSNRPEFHIADLAVMTLGATPFSLYSTLSPEQIQFVVGDADARIGIIEEEFLEQISGARELGLPDFETVVVLEGERGEGTVAWEDVSGTDPGFDPEPHWRAQEPGDLLTLIYTSGTTGPPKGVQLTHKNLMAAVKHIENIIEFPDESRVISWLPSAHVAERVAHHYLPIVFGMTVTCCANPRDVVSYLPAVRPTWFFAVPRIWEKLRGAMLSGVFTPGSDDRAHLDAAIEQVRLQQAGEPVPDAVAAEAAKGEEKYAQVRAMLGLDQAVAVNAGAAPTPPEVIMFFHAVGIPLGELWGMSETCGAGTVNPPDKIKIGTVGPPIEGVELKLADDGEVLMRSDVVMGGGYRNLPDKTAEAIDTDGWLHTGDIGQIDEDGYLKIVDRKKEIIINAAGKNMSPANIEATVKSATPLIGNVCCIGDALPYNTALIALDPDFAPMWAGQHGLQDTSLAALSESDAVRAEIQTAVDAANAKLARVEQVKYFTLMPTDWLPGGDELTPTMKLKRKPIAAKYAAEITAMYESNQR
ncbi:MAG: long-chain acyl-CoA synthetase [Solirubrobacteraceae bacterium]|nr:long-chain acyl-CoA synthetase [Solirubrobacteraceae bacterium]